MEESPVGRELLVAKFRAILGNRDRLTSMRAVFDELDVDGNGTLSADELKAGIDHLVQRDIAEKAASGGGGSERRRG